MPRQDRSQRKLNHRQREAMKLRRQKGGAAGAASDDDSARPADATTPSGAGATINVPPAAEAWWAVPSVAAGATPYFAVPFWRAFSS